MLRKPFIASPMDTVMNAECGIALAKSGALGILHYNYKTLSDQLNEIEKVKKITNFDAKTATSANGRLCIGALIQSDFDSIPHVKELIEVGTDIIAIDTLHTSPHLHVPLIKELKFRFPELSLISGNVVHPDDCIQVIEAGVDCLRIGYSSGSINNGRAMFGHARSQVASIRECSKVSREFNIPLISDGGIRTTGDISIAFSLGANFIMAGRLFACSNEAPGEILVDENGRQYKKYKGMSRASLIETDTPPEGSEIDILIKGSIQSITANLANCLKISIARAGCFSLKDFVTDCKLEILTANAIRDAGVP